MKRGAGEQTETVQQGVKARVSRAVDAQIATEVAMSGNVASQKASH